MQNMRDLLRTSLARSLAALSPLDRLAAAWPVAAGHAIAERSEVTALTGTSVTIAVADAAWQRQLQSTAEQLCAQLARTSGVPLTDILFLSPGESASPRTPARPTPRKSA